MPFIGFICLKQFQELAQVAYLIRIAGAHGPPNARGPLEVLVGLFTDVSDFLGRLLVIAEFYSHGYFLYEYVFFFQKSSSGGIR